MAKIQDIINFARETGIADVEFMDTFDPQHIALMEAVIERTWFATDSWETSYCCGHDLFDGHAESCPVEKLFKFRKEHGLDG